VRSPAPLQPIRTKKDTAVDENQPTPKDYYLGFNHELDRQSVSNLVALVQQALSLRARSVTICITSSGGALDHGLYAYEILTALPISIHTHAIGQVQSAAMPLFLSGSRRTASPGANFLFHDALFHGDGMLLNFDKLTGEAQAIEHNNRLSHRLIAGVLDRPVEDVAKWFIGQNIRDTGFALDNGIIEKVEPLVVPPEAQFVQVAYRF
jgi:ATP-dependent protease ClpP protease subunit